MTIIPTQPGGVTPKPARAVRVMHAVLMAGGVATPGVIFAAGAAGVPHPLLSATLGNGIAGASIVAAAAALLVLRPRVPERASAQPPDEFWSTIAARGAALLTWAVLEGAVTLGGVGYLITGAPAGLAAAALAWIALAASGPAMLERPS